MKKRIITIVGALIVVIAVFYGGMIYGKSQTGTKSPSSGTSAGGQGFGTGRMRNGGSGGGNSGGFVSGQIISKDNQSIIVELSNGSSTSSGNSTKIVLVSNSTPITKSVNGTLDDLTTGENVTVVGTANSDGSVTAQSIQIRPTNSPAGNPGQQANPQQ